LHQRISDRSISMRMVFHGITDNIGNLIVTPVIQFAHRVQNPSLYRFQTIVHVRDGPFENNIGSIVQKPLLVHPVQMLNRTNLPTFFSRMLHDQLRDFLVVFYVLFCSCRFSLVRRCLFRGRTIGPGRYLFPFFVSFFTSPLHIQIHVNYILAHNTISKLP